MEDLEDKKGKFGKLALASMPDLASTLPIGINRSFCGKTKGVFEIASNLVCRQAIYKGEPVFQSMFGTEKTLGDIYTPVAATIFIPDTTQTVTIQNKKTKFLVPSRMEHDLFVVRKDVHVWKVCGWSSMIPWVFSFAKKHWISPPPSSKDPTLEEDNSTLGACNVASVNAFPVVDGAVSAAYGAIGAACKKNMVVVTVYKTKKAKPLDYKSGSRLAGWWLFGAFVSLYRSAVYAIQNEGEDKLAILKQMYDVKELCCKAKEARTELEEIEEKEMPDHAQFHKYDLPTIKKVFNHQYFKMRTQIKKEFSTDTLERYAREGFVCCVSSGGAYAIDELAAITALCDLVLEKVDPTDERQQKQGIINLITGTSAGSLNALYISQIHDKIFGLEVGMGE